MRIKQIKIEKLFGLEKNNFDIACYPNEYITILYAFNGTGKTTLLRLIDAVLDVKLQILDSIPFKKIELFFDNEDFVCVEKNGEYKKSFGETCVKDLYCFDAKGSLKQFEGKEDETPIYPISYTTVLDKKEEKYYLQFSNDFAQEVREEYKKDSNQIIKHNSKKINTLAFQYLNVCYFEQKEKNDILKFKMFLVPELKTKIKTLGIFANKDFNRFFSEEINFEETNSTLGKFLESEAFTNYKQNGTIAIEASELQKNWNFSSKFFYDIPDKTETICKEIKEKIKTNLTEVEKFIDLINKKFIMEFKKLEIDNEAGLVIVPTDPYDDFEKLPLSILSSGEKNLIVLFYELMFITPEKEFPNQEIIVLIDEPESSLHILWQNQLLQAIMDIVKEKKNIQVIVATHSAEIVNEYIGLQSPMVSERIKYE